jgi:hypothetical protein
MHAENGLGNVWIGALQTSAAGMIGILESDRDLNGGWWDYKGDAIPW